MTRIPPSVFRALLALFALCMIWLGVALKFDAPTGLIVFGVLLLAVTFAGERRRPPR